MPPHTQFGSRRPERQSYRLWEQLFFELLTDIVSC
jgi:hypothetical protein